MIKRLLGSVREFKKPSILTLLLMVGEVVIEVLIPFIAAELISSISEGELIIGEVIKVEAFGVVIETKF